MTVLQVGSVLPNTLVGKLVTMVEVPVSRKVAPLATLKVLPATPPPSIAKPPLARVPLCTVRLPCRLVVFNAIPSVTVVVFDARIEPNVTLAVAGSVCAVVPVKFQMVAGKDVTDPVVPVMGVALPEKLTCETPVAAPTRVRARLA